MRNNLGYYIPQSQTGCCEQGLGGPCELINGFLMTCKRITAPHPQVQSAIAPVDSYAESQTARRQENPLKLTQEQARQIALEHLNLTADQVTRLRSDFEMDDGIPQFDVEFLQGDWEYEFEIHGETGKILSYDKDHKYD